MNKSRNSDTWYNIYLFTVSSCLEFSSWKFLRLYTKSKLSNGIWLKVPRLSTWLSITGFIVGIITLVLLLDWWFEIFCEPSIPGLPRIPGWPIVGNLFQQGPSAAITYRNWKHDVFQLRLGTKRVVVANSFDSIYNLWQVNWKTNISRPVLYTFHQVMSQSQGVTIGTTPYSETWKKMRKVVAANLSNSSIQHYAPILDRNSLRCISSLQESIGKDIDVHPILKTFTLCISVEINYGISFDHNHSMFEEIVTVEKEINRARSAIHNNQDYLPFLRFWPFNIRQNHSVEEFRIRRDKYMNQLLEVLKNNVNNGTSNSCIGGNILLNKTKTSFAINETELRTICLTMVSAGLDTIPSNIVSCIGHLGHPVYGAEIQAKAFEAIQKFYPDGDAWDRCLTDAKYVPYILMLIKETLRFTTSQPISLPRETYGSSITYNQTVVIPPGTMLLMNTLAGNFDSERYKDPFKFNPERFSLDSKKKVFQNYTIDHLGFGAGSRMCAGYKLATREFYVMLVRLILKFRVLPPKDDCLPILETDVLKSFSKVDNMVVEPNRFFVSLESR